MFPIVVLAAVAVAGSVPLLVWSLTGDRGSSTAVARNLAGVGTADLRQVSLRRSAGQRVGRPMVGSLARKARRITPVGWIGALERRITLAGRPVDWPLERVLAAKLLLGGAGALVGFLVFADRRTLGWLLLWAVITALFYLAPDLILYSRGQERQQAIQQALPDTLDQMTISVEAGLGFESAMARAGRSGGGPLADELVRTLQEIQVGVPRAQAFRHLADRTTVPDLRHFVHAVLQAEAYGVPIADVLRTQAGELRTKRRQRAEERAMKIPVKVIFPLILCIMPALFIVMLGPAAIRIKESLLDGALGG